MKIKSKISKLQDFEKKHLFSCIKLKRPLSSGQNWFLRPFSASIIVSMFGYENGLIFSVRALEVLFLHRLFLTLRIKRPTMELFSSLGSRHMCYVLQWAGWWKWKYFLAKGYYCSFCGMNWVLWRPIGDHLFSDHFSAVCGGFHICQTLGTFYLQILLLKSWLPLDLRQDEN